MRPWWLPPSGWVCSRSSHWTGISTCIWPMTGTPSPLYRSSLDPWTRHLLERIQTNPEIFGGKPIIRGMRISVELILSLLAQGATEEAILGDYPELEPDDIRACLAYAHAVMG
ncbi:MAG TPA: DUF433 domain-containing protein [Thermoanaerobaculia bacterium]|nr:DUF433 domain-containing protein [Thermoanaerobaculia bacterium]